MNTCIYATVLYIVCNKDIYACVVASQHANRIYEYTCIHVYLYVGDARTISGTTYI